MQAAIVTVFGKKDALKKYQKALSKKVGTGGLVGDLRRFAGRLVEAQVLELPNRPVRSR